MNQAIVTRHVRGGFPAICARMGADLSTVREYPASLEEFPVDQRHALAAFTFCQKFDCFGVYVGAALSAGAMVWVPLPEDVQDLFTYDMRRMGRDRRQASQERRTWFRWVPLSRDPLSTDWPSCL